MTTETEHPDLAVMFTDIKGYSRMMSENEAAALGVLTEHNQIMESVIGAHGGRVVKKLGDSYMVIFDHGDAAVKCGLHALNKIASRNRRSEQAVEIRVGIHEGAMFEREGDFFGENVNIAARLEQMARPMTVAVSERVLQDVATRVKCEARFVGAEALKNLRYPVSVYQLTPSDSWKLYLSPDGPVAGAAQGDLLSEITSADTAWRRVDEMVRDGDLDAAAQLGDAALSKFGGTFEDYAQLAAVYLIARKTAEARSILKMGEMLGQQGEQHNHLEWLVTLAGNSPEALKQQPDELAQCLAAAAQYVAEHPEQLPMAVLLEGIKARFSGHLGGMTRLVQNHPDCALVLRGYAETLHDEHRDADAHSMLEKAIKVAPHVADHQLRRVQWMVDGGDLESVISESKSLAAQFANDARVYEWTGLTRLLNLDPHGAQWIFEQSAQSGQNRGAQSLRWQICCLMQQGRFDSAVEHARKELRRCIRQNLTLQARDFLQFAVSGIHLEHWDGVLELLEEYLRFDNDWPHARAALTAAKVQRRLMPWERALAQLNELSAQCASDYPHPSGTTVMALWPVAQEHDQWEALHHLEFLQAHRNWIIQEQDLTAALMEARGALRLQKLETWHLQLVPVLTHLRSRLDHRLPSLLALAGLIQARLNNYEGGKPHLEQAGKMWHDADWAPWEIREAEATLAAGSTSQLPS